MADPPLLKDLVDEASVESIGVAVAGVFPGFDESKFLGDVFSPEWGDLALKQRIRHIAVTLRTLLGGEYAEGLEVMRKAARNLSMRGIPVWCFNDFVEEYGVDDPDISLPALEQFTRLASAEFAVRPFIRRYPERMAAQMLEWAASDDEHVRRLASEGFRPRLPWGMGLPGLKKDPGPILPVLERLYRDPSETVRRSVANNLNDISKDHPQVVVDVLAGWALDSAEGVALRKHALRTLLKQGDPGALDLLGFAKDAPVGVIDMKVSPEEAAVGGHVIVEFRVVPTAPGTHQVMIDYAVVFQNVSGTGSRKVFKGKVEELGAGESITLRRKVSLKQMTTRRIVPGPHVIEAQVNGVVRATVGFDVVG